jgi:hypothetical protein
MPRVPGSARSPKVDATSPLTAIAPPQDATQITPLPKGAPASREDMAMPAVTSLWDAQRIWFDVATKAWLRTMQLSIEAASCPSVEAWMDLHRRHTKATIHDFVAGWSSLAAVSGEPLPPKPGPAVHSTGV